MQQHFQISRKILFLLFSLSFLLIFIVYSNHFHNIFHFDDSHVVENNIYIQNLKNIPHFFTDATLISSLPSNQQYRPMIPTTLAFDYWLGGKLDPFWFHVSMFGWFLIQCGFLFYFFLKIANSVLDSPWNPLFALFAMTLYGVHTVNAETINYICARSDSMSTCWLMIAFAIFIKFPNARKWQLHLFPFLIACLFKQTVIVYPVLLFLYILLFEAKQSLFDLFQPSTAPQLWTMLLKSTAPTWFLALGLCIFLRHMDPSTYQTGGFSVYHYLITQPFVMLHYFFSFFLPLQLSADTDWMPLSSAINDQFFAGVIFILGLIILAFRTSKTATLRPVAFGILWFFITLLPTSVIPLAEVMNDHRLFFPLIGVTLSVTFGVYQWLLTQAAWFKNSTHQWIMLNVILLILGIFAYGTHQRNEIWKTEESLWYDVTQKSPKNARGLMNYGLTQMQKGDYVKAEQYFLEALHYTPMYGALHTNLAIVSLALGKTQLAESYYENAIRYSPDVPGILNFYAAYYLTKKPEVAEQVLTKSLSLSPGDMHTHYLLMDLYWNQENWNKLTGVVDDALKLSPTDSRSLEFKYYADHHFNRLNAQIKETEAHPNEANYLKLSLFYYEQKDFNQALKASFEIIKINPNSAEAYNNVCYAYNAMKQYSKAEGACKKAIEIKPDFQLAKNNLLESQRGQQKHG